MNTDEHQIDSNIPTGFSVFCCFSALRLHFTEGGTYNYFQYNGKTNCTEDHFNRRKDRWEFEKIAKIYRKDMIGYFVSNLVLDPKFWPTAGNRKTSKNVYFEWVKFNTCPSRYVSEDIDKVFEVMRRNKIRSASQLYEKSDTNTHPVLLRMYLSKEISLNTFCLLMVVGKSYWDEWDSGWLRDDIIWPKISDKLRRYLPFMELLRDEESLRLILDKWRRCVIMECEINDK